MNRRALEAAVAAEFAAAIDALRSANRTNAPWPEFDLALRRLLLALASSAAFSGAMTESDRMAGLAAMDLEGRDLLDAVIRDADFDDHGAVR